MSRRRGALSVRRTVTGWALALAGPPALTAVLLQERDVLGLASDLMMFFTLVVTTALIGGLAPSLSCALLAAWLLNYFFTEPTGGLTIADPENALALVVFALVATAVASVVGLAERRRADAGEARAEAAALADLSRAVLAGRDTPEGIVEELVKRFDAGTGLVLHRDAAGPSGWTTVASYPSGAPATPEVSLGDVVPNRVAGDVALALPGHRLTAADGRVFTAFAEQAAVVLDRARLRREADRARELEHLNAARTAILTAASHDLRTPLAAVRAAVDGLGAHGPALDEEDRASLLDAVEVGTARLERLTDNLLDLSRLQMGAVHPQTSAVSLEEVVPLALEGLSPDAIVLDLLDDLPLVLTDAGLLERIVANLAANAVLHGPSGSPARVTARVRGDRMVIAVSDFGPGMPHGEVQGAFAAFERLGSHERRRPSGGLGLGLAVVRGLADALGVEVEARQTPGGGLTMEVSVPLAGTGEGAP
ncbi:DUF4118 domain-containing protein [Actinotalea sp. K2]|uniref:sensor histidine kinase n=1 Tax=Actinotalea sp. K2 TaxID=2939438 RepID=UPI002017966E|nr:DUF4118 domain-containing protein [Actinotalea sp. K2]MCL3861084.1 DUF4118 domain-containing protein [Actinotalea sp. K2]